MISTLNETSLHRTLKLLYAGQTGGKVEQEINGKICDVLTPQGGVIEIQTTSVSSLAGKVASLIQEREVTIVFPFAEQKIIQKNAGEAFSSKKSPKKQSVYAIFREITGLYPYLFHPNFTLEALPAVIREIRVVTDSPVQSANNSRRHLKNWNKKDKELVSLKTPLIFKTPGDYLSLLPFKADEEFSAKDLSRTPAKGDAPWMLWVLSKCGLVTQVRKVGNTRIFTRT